MSAARDRLFAESVTAQAIGAMRRASNDMPAERAAYLIARSALLTIGAFRGVEEAASKAYALADELATAGGKS